jgi:hypothetical protein
VRGRAPAARSPVHVLGACFGVGLALSQLACGPPPVTPSRGELTLGTIDTRRFGDTRWVDLADGDGVELAPGAQGGFHVWVKYRIKGLSGPIRVSRIADRLGESGKRDRVLTAPSTLVQLPRDAGSDFVYESPEPIPSFMCPTPIDVNVLDAPLELKVTLTAAEPAPPQVAETLTSVTVTLRPRCPPPEDSTHAFCLQICQG